jgi:hypothetical protein
MIRRVGALLGVLVSAACEGSPDEATCRPAPECHVIDADATDGDARALWAEGQMVGVTLNGTTENIAVKSGEAVWTPDPNDPDCFGACAIVLKRLKVGLNTLYFASSQDAVRVRNLEVSFEGPILLGSPDGLGAVLPVGMKTETCAAAENVLTVHQAALASEGRITARSASEALHVELNAPAFVDGSTDLGCIQFNLAITGTLTGATPFDANPVETMP